MNTGFSRGRTKRHYLTYCHRLKIPFTKYNQELEDFCNDRFGCNWAVRHYNEKYRPMATGRETYYVFGFINEEDAVLFKMRFNFSTPLTSDEAWWDDINDHS